MGTKMRMVRKLAVAAAIVITTATSFSATQAATPKDTLVTAWQLDSILSLDPAEVFEFTGAEIMGNTYERLIGYDPNDVSKMHGDVAEFWTVSPDEKTFTFKVR